MAFVCLSIPISSTSTVFNSTPSTTASSTIPSSSKNLRFRCSLTLTPLILPGGGRTSLMVASYRRGQVVCMAPEEEKMTRRSPLDFPIEWERPRPGRRPDIFPQFSPMKTPLPPPLPADPPEEDEEEEEKKQEEEEDPEKENPDEPEKQ